MVIDDDLSKCEIDFYNNLHKKLNSLTQQKVDLKC